MPVVIAWIMLGLALLLNVAASLLIVRSTVANRRSLSVFLPLCGGAGGT